MFSQEIFRNPPNEYRGTDFWMLNDALDEADIRHQLQEMKAQGVASVIARTYIGLKSDYPGADFKRKMHVIVDTAKEVGIKIFLQAGYMPEAVLDLPPDYAIRNLTPMPEAESEGKGDILAVEDGIAYVAVNTVTFLDMMSKDAIKFYLKQSYEDMWKEFEDEFGETCISVWVDEPSYSSAALPWSMSLPAVFQEDWGYDIVPKVPLLYRDLPGYETVRYHYWLTVQKMLKEAYFEQVRDWCHAHNLLFSGHLMMEDTLESQLARAGATMPYYKYFDIPGIDYLTAEMPWRNSPLKRRTASLDYRPGMFTTPLQCTSAAHQAGKEQILAEMYGVSSENLTFRDQKNMFDHFASFGINHRSVHGIFYSLRGRGKRAYPPHVNYYQPYWKDYKMLTDYCGRASYFISQGTPVKDVVMLHPLSSAATELRGPKSPDGATGRVQLRSRKFLDVQLQLHSVQCDFELVDEDTLNDWGKTVDDNGEKRLEVGCMSYATVILSDIKALASSTLRILTEFANAGGRVLIQGEKPSLLDGWNAPDLEEKLSFATYFATVDQLVEYVRTLPKSYRLCCEGDGTTLHVNHRRDAETDYFFIFNRDCREARRMTLTLPGNKLAARLPEDGGVPQPLPKTNAEDGTSFKVEVPEGGSVMVIARDCAEVVPGEIDTLPPSPLTSSLALATTWQLERMNDNVFYLEFATYRTENQDFGSTYPILAINDMLTKQDYHGPLTLRFAFHSDVELDGLKLALEGPAGQEIFLNGTPVPNCPEGYFVAKQFETITLPVSIKPGENVIEIRRYFEPLAKARSSITSLFENLPGVELEAMYLVGDFAVNSRQKPTLADALRLSFEFRLAHEQQTVQSEIVTKGYPFYSGTMALTQEIDVPATCDCANATLVLDSVSACHVRVLLNGQYQGETGWAPFSVSLASLKPGKNTLRLEVTNTLKNLLGPHHRPKGEYGECWSGYGFPNLPWLGPIDEGTRQHIDDWENKRIPDTSAWTEDYMLVPFGLADAKIVFNA